MKKKAGINIEEIKGRKKSTFWLLAFSFVLHLKPIWCIDRGKNWFRRPVLSPRRVLLGMVLFSFGNIAMHVKKI